MAAIKEIKIPDIGGAQDVDVIEIFVKPGDNVNKDQSLLTLESEKASMEIPAPFAGKVKELRAKIGDKVSEGAIILTLETAEEPLKKGDQIQKNPAEEKIAEKVTEKTTAKTETSTTKEVRVPDIGGTANVDVIEILVKPGDQISKEASLITLESEKASMEIPSPYAGIIKEIKVAVGDKVSEGTLILTMDTVSEGQATQPTRETPAKQEKPSTEIKKPQSPSSEIATPLPPRGEIHAGPLVRQMARELGVDLSQIRGTGPKGRIVKEDVQAFVKSELQKSKAGGIAIPSAPVVDFSKFGDIETKSLNKIKRFTAINVHRSWVTVPHVTQFDEVDITELEKFRNAEKAEAEKQGVKLTPLVFIMKAVVAALKEYPIFNTSLDPTGENLIYKKYFNIGIAADTPNGLVVPVIRNVDCKGILELAKELRDISNKAREKGLTPAEMAGSCFTISSLGGIGGTAFTPIINGTDVAILGVSKAVMKPVYQDGQFVPRLMLPLSLSYDHRVVDGADGARFIVYLAKRLMDIKTLLL